MPKVKNPQVFMDISIDKGKAERITFELFANVVPKTAENFRALCTGERGLGASTMKPLYFKGTNFYRIIPGFVAQGGDFSMGDGLGGESIYGGKFPDENFKLKHDKPGVLSMANSGAHSNGSLFFITFKPIHHLEGHHVVFGKVVTGVDLLKKLEAVGSENGVPSCEVKIVDCGEVSGTNTGDKVKREKEKKLKKADVNSDDEQRVQTKKVSRDSKRSKKRKHYSSDSFSSDTDSRSYSLDSVSESESYSSSSMDTSSSSDQRHKRRKGSKKDKHKSTKRKGKHSKSRKKTRGSKRKSRRYGSSSDDSKSSKTDSSSSDSESADHRTRRSLPKGQENTKTAYSEQVKTVQVLDKGKEPVSTGNKPHDETEADDRSDPGASSKNKAVKVNENLTETGKEDGNNGADAAGTGTEMNPASIEPVATNGKGSMVGAADNGQRVRKGRGFTEKYAFARRYRTPSPERFPVRSRYNSGRNDRWNNFNRYGRNGSYARRSPVRRYRGSPGVTSPSRYSRRDRSRSRSRSPVRRYDHGGYRRPSPRRSHSPGDQPRRDLSNRLRSGHGAGVFNQRSSSPPVNRGRSRSRSKSRDPSQSRSPDPVPAKRGSSKYNRRRSSSSRSSSPDDGNKGLVSY